jgi:hypothetical protein
MMKKLLCSIIILAVAGFAHAEMFPPWGNPGFENGMSGWATWGSGSGSGPSGYKWTSHWAYIDTTGNGAWGNNFMNLTTSSQIGYIEYWGWGYNVTWRSSSADLLEVTEGTPVTMNAWARDVLGGGARLELKFEWLDASGLKPADGGIVPSGQIFFDITTDWAYYQATLVTPVNAYGLRPCWANPDPGTEVGLDFIPEPMSIALLGFGALGLRRRK